MSIFELSTSANTLTNERRQFLKRERVRLQARLDAIHQDIERGLDHSLSEQAVELENRDVLNEIARVTAEQLEGVKRALVNAEE